MTPTTNAPAKPATWRSTVVGIVLLAFTGARVYFNPAALTDPQTIAMFTGAAGMILGSDKLLGK